MKINPMKPCIRLYAFSKIKGHSTAEVFLQQDCVGDIHSFLTQGESYAQVEIRVSLPEVKEFQAIARFRGGE
jgi:hypothetical protein